MITDASTFNESQYDQELEPLHVGKFRHRRNTPNAIFETSGRQKQANRARFSRRGSAGSFNGAHRRRDKRNGL